MPTDRLNEYETTALALKQEWTMGLRDNVIVFLSLEKPLVAAYMALALLGFITMDDGPAAGTEFIEAVREGAER